MASGKPGIVFRYEHEASRTCHRTLPDISTQSILMWLTGQYHRLSVQTSPYPLLKYCCILRRENRSHAILYCLPSTGRAFLYSLIAQLIANSRMSGIPNLLVGTFRSFSLVCVCILLPPLKRSSSSQGKSCCSDRIQAEGRGSVRFRRLRGSQGTCARDVSKWQYENDTMAGSDLPATD